MERRASLHKDSRLDGRDARPSTSVVSPCVLAHGSLQATLFLQGEDFLGENFGESLLSALQSRA